jgi:hypothetical protein
MELIRAKEGLASEARGWGPKDTSLDVLRHPIRIRILEACNLFDRLSPVEMLHKGVLRDVESVRKKPKFKDKLSHVGYHCRELAKADCLVLVDEQPVRGASVQHFYRATAEAFFSDEDWAKLNYDERFRISRVMWRGFIARVENAMMFGTFDKRKGRYLYWDLLVLDLQGWEELETMCFASYEEAQRIKWDSKARVEETGAKPIQATFALFGFESPPVLEITSGDNQA